MAKSLGKTDSMRRGSSLLWLWMACLSCGEGGDTREKSTGAEMKADPLTTSSGSGAGDDAAAAGGGDGGGGGGGGGATGGGSTSTATSTATSTSGGDPTVGDAETEAETQLTGRTLEQCSSESKAWIPVVDSGAKPAECGERLINFCCARSEIKSRFPSFAVELENRFKTTVDTDGYVLYHCSTNDGTSASALRTTFHFVKIGNGRTDYRTHYVESVAPGSDALLPHCPEQVTTDEISTYTTPSGLSFADDIAPILAASCAGAACHDDNSATTDAKDHWLTDETKFKARADFIIGDLDADVMPKAPVAPLDDATKKKIASFLGLP